MHLVISIQLLVVIEHMMMSHMPGFHVADHIIKLLYSTCQVQKKAQVHACTSEMNKGLGI